MIIYIIILIVLILILAYFAAIMPRIYKRPDYMPLLGTYYAHRGLHDHGEAAPENSKKAFAKAVEAGYGIELDVQLTKDNVPVVFHDENLKRACKDAGKVRDYTYEELMRFSLFESKEKIPKFDEVLSIINAKVPLIIEIKMYTASTKVCELTNETLKDYKGTYCMESFHPLAVLWYRKHRPDVIRGQLSSNFKKDLGTEILAHFVVHHLLTNYLTRPDFVAYCHLYKNELSRTICRKCYKSLSVAWTIRTQEELDRAKKDFDLFIFENFIPLESEVR